MLRKMGWEGFTPGEAEQGEASAQEQAFLLASAASASEAGHERCADGAGGLGARGQGLVTPVAAMMQHNSDAQGLGSDVGDLRESEIRKMLTDLVQAPQGTPPLVFDPSFSAAERKLVHNLAQQYGLSHRSYGKGAARQLMVGKRTEKEAAFEHEKLMKKRAAQRGGKGRRDSGRGEGKSHDYRRGGGRSGGSGRGGGGKGSYGRDREGSGRAGRGGGGKSGSSGRGGGKGGRRGRERLHPYSHGR